MFIFLNLLVTGIGESLGFLRGRGHKVPANGKMSKKLAKTNDIFFKQIICMPKNVRFYFNSEILS